MRRKLTAALFALALLGLWEGLTRAQALPRLLVPAPADVARYLAASAADGSLAAATGVTLRRLVLGFVASLALGLPLGLLTARFAALADTLGVLALGLQTLPSVCWVPLALLWFGQTETAMFFIVLMGSLWSVLLAVDNGVRGVPPIYARAARTMGSSGLHTWLTVLVPAALPAIVSGTRQGWAFAWRSLMAAEIYVTILSGFGLGHLLHYGRELHAMDAVLGVMLVIVLVGVLAHYLLFAPCERFLHRRWGTDRR